MNYIPVHPKNANRQQKNATINRNIYQSSIGGYQMCPWKPSIRVSCRSDFDRKCSSRKICRVMTKHMHPLDIVGGLSNRGLSELKSANRYSTIINPMYKEFNGKNHNTDHACPDESILLRTNFPFVIKKQENIVPVSNDSEIVYTPLITVIRDMFYNEIPHENLYRTGVITVTPPQPELMEKILRDGDRYEKIKILTPRFFTQLQAQLETAFQVAAMCGHNSIIVSLFDIEFGIPIDDQILLYNYCILKYGHFFDAAIFGVPPYESAELVEYLEEKLVKPQRIASDVEMRVRSDIMCNKFKVNNPEEAKIDDDNDEPIQGNRELTESEKIAHMKKQIRLKKKSSKKSRKKSSKSKSSRKSKSSKKNRY